MSTLEFTALDEIPRILDHLRKSFFKNITKPIEYRKQQLKQLYFLLEENEEAFVDALHKDLRRHRNETVLAEIFMVKAEIQEAIKHIDAWAKPEYVKVSLANKLNGCHIRKDPKGMVLVISSWNYPVQLLICPMIAAIAAGNTVVGKPSEISPHTAALITRLFNKYMDPDCYRIINGGPTETTLLLEKKWDHIFYTGSGGVGKIIMTAAAKHLTPVTLELGGKCPSIIVNDADIDIAAKRLLWSKGVNVGQTCLATDYILCERHLQDKLVAALKKQCIQLYGDGDIKKNDHYARVVSQRHWNRLMNMLKESNGDIVIGGQSDASDLYIAPTVVANVTGDDALMADEIFGPILPIVPVGSLEEAIDFVNARDQPLALYVFTNDKNTAKYVLDNTRSGGALVNDTIMHITVPNLPFGGVGPSGMGNYHGQQGFNTFSHARSTMSMPFRMERLIDARYPPYNASKLKQLEYLLVSRINYKKSGRGFWGTLILGLFLAAAGTAVASNQGALKNILKNWR